MPTIQRAAIGRYRIIDFVGAGGMGEVYRVVDTGSGRIAALKVLTATRGATMLERFRNEARIHSTLQHRGIATMYEFLETDGMPCIAMEFVDGDTLEQRIRAAGSLDQDQALRIFAGVVDVVSYLHARGVVHRDLKSNNVKIDDRGQVKLLDFGIAKSHNTPKLTTDGNVIGTLHYLSPEQLRTGQADARSDVWALGVLLYEMVTGHMPFEGGALGVVTERLLKGMYVPASTIRSSVTREVDRIIGRCLRVQAGDRYANAEALLTDVRALLTGEQRTRGLLRIDPATSGEVGRALRRHGPLAASVSAAGLALAFLIWSLPPETTTGSTGQAADTTFALPPAEIADTPRPEPRSGELVIGSGTLSTATITVPGDLHADVVYQGRVVGRTPFRVRAPAGAEVVLTLRLTGYADEPIRFTMTVFDNEFQHVLMPIAARGDSQGFAARQDAARVKFNSRSATAGLSLVQLRHA